MMITQILREEHEVILRVLDALESVAREADTAARKDQNSATLDLESGADALEFLTTFADRCHHGKEEDLLFAKLVTRGLPRQVGPIAVMLSDHEEGRGLRKQMAQAYEDARAGRAGSGARFARPALAYVEMMRDHIDKENGVLYPMADGMLSDADQVELEKGCTTVERDHMGAGVHERELARAEALCKRRGIDMLAAHTHGTGACCGHKKGCGS